MQERGIYSLADEIEDTACTLSANANTQSEREASRSVICTRGWYHFNNNNHY